MANDKNSKQEKAADRGKKKVEAFKKLAVKRTNRALDSISRIIPLANPRSYTFDTAQSAKIVAALRAEVEKVASAFASGGGAKSAGFDL